MQPIHRIMPAWGVVAACAALGTSVVAQEPIRLGMVGLDTSHVVAFTEALNDPEAGFKAWNPRGSVELGETRTRTFHWLSTLRALGRPDRGVSADTSLYTVFRRADGSRTYVTYLPPRAQPRSVRFSDGTVVKAQPGQLVQVRRP